MKKMILLFIAVMAFSVFTTQAQTSLSLPFNQYSGQTPNYAFQAKVTSEIPANYQAAVGDIITVRLAGTSDYDLTQFQTALVDVRAAVSYWSELGGFKSLGAVTAGAAFDVTVDIAVTKDGAGEGPTYSNLILDASSKAAINASATSVTLSLTAFEVTITPAQSGVTTLTKNDNGAYQLSFTDILDTATALKVGDIVKVSISGTSDRAITNFLTVIVDETQAANYWTELSAFGFLSDSVPAGEPFDLIAYDTIKTAPIGSGYKSQNVVLIGESSGNIGITITEFTASIVNVIGIEEAVSAKTLNIYPNPATEGVIYLGQIQNNVLIYNQTGSLIKSLDVATKVEVSDLSTGLYILKSDLGTRKFYVVQ